jgi:hypothetical protein
VNAAGRGRRSDWSTASWDVRDWGTAHSGEAGGSKSIKENVKRDLAYVKDLMKRGMFY